MAKVYITTKNGTKLTIEGTSDEVAALVERFEGSSSHHEKPAPSKRISVGRASKGKIKSGPVNLVSELIEGGYFKKPKGLAAIKSTLEERGHFYPVTTLSPILLRMVKGRQLRRVKEKKRWSYVG
jgi:hypothetical protein